MLLGPKGLAIYLVWGAFPEAEHRPYSHPSHIIFRRWGPKEVLNRLTGGVMFSGEHTTDPCSPYRAHCACSDRRLW